MLSHTELKILDEKLRAGGGCCVFTAHGMLCAITSGPFDIPEGLWMQFMWGMWRKFDSLSEQRELKALILKSKEQITRILEKRCRYYPLVRYDQKFNEPIFLEDLPNLILWARGYLQGIMLAEQFWNICIDNIECFIFQVKKLAGVDENKVHQMIIDRDIEKLEKLIQILEKTISGIIPALYDYWRDPKIIKRYRKKLNKLIAAEKKSGVVYNGEIPISIDDKVIAVWKAIPNDFGYGNVSGVPLPEHSICKVLH